MEKTNENALKANGGASLKKITNVDVLLITNLIFALNHRFLST